MAIKPSGWLCIWITVSQERCPYIGWSLNLQLLGLPAVFRRLITGCLVLKQRCIKEKGECWPNIVHVPCMDINCDNLRLKVISLCSNLEGKFIQPYPILTFNQVWPFILSMQFYLNSIFPTQKERRKSKQKERNQRPQSPPYINY